MSQDLKPTSVDHVALALRASLGAIPWLGPLFSELVSVALPRQRVERVALFVERLAYRLDLLEQDVRRIEIDALPPAGAALLEEGAHTAAKALSPERIDQIALVVAMGLAGPEQALDRERDLLALIGRLSDGDISFLLQLRHPTHHRIEDFKKSKNYYPKIDPNLPGREAEFAEVMWGMECHRRLDERFIGVQKVEALGLVRALPEQRNPPDEREIFWPIETHEYEVTSLGDYVLWRLGLVKNGVVYVNGYAEPDAPVQCYPSRMTDEMITLMLDYSHMRGSKRR